MEPIADVDWSMGSHAARLADWDAAFRAQVTLPKFPERDIAVVIRVSMQDAAIMNLVNFGMEGDMVAEVHMVME